ncbi:MAG TPA: hypothetical protein VM165_05540 [Planctomycetaceae bacterium]|nr:hypothetical protein [Planctomycetaceae bacterium]
MSNLPFITAVTTFAAVLIVAIVGGVRNWKDTAGKVVAVIAGVLLAALLAFVSLVALIVASGNAGHPF